MWNPLKRFADLDYKKALSAEDYLRLNASLMAFYVIFCLAVAVFFIATLGFVMLSRLGLPDTSLNLGYTIGGFVAGIPYLIVSCIVLFYAFKMTIMRFHDFGISGWWLLLLVFLFSITLFFQQYKIILFIV